MPTEDLPRANALRDLTVDAPVGASLAETGVVQLEGEVLAAAVGDEGGLL